MVLVLAVSIWINETKKLQEQFLYELTKLDWQFDLVGMYTPSKDSVRVRNKNKGKKKKRKKERNIKVNWKNIFA